MTEALVAAIDELVGTDPSALADSETIALLHRQLARLEAATVRATAAWDASREWAADGARNGAQWLASTCHLPKGVAHRTVRLGRELRHLPVAERAWLDGHITCHHVAALAAKRNDTTAHAMTADEAMLVDQAATLRYETFTRALAYWHQLHDADGAERDAEAKHERRRVDLSQTFEGCWALDGLLDPIGGSVVANALRRIEQELFDADWAEARERLGDGALAADLRRTPKQRRADALVEMARRSMAVPAGARMPAPLFTVLVGYETFAGRICELADGTAITPGSLLRWLDDAYIERVVFDSPSRVVDVGERRRLFQGATRRAVQVRDRECYHDTCDEPADRCDIDHVLPHAWGGPTIQTNGRAACGFHNRNRQRQPQGP